MITHILTHLLRTAAVSLLAVSAITAAPLFEQVDVFTAGTEGYHTFRIPTIVTAPDGSLLVFAEARKENRSDPGGGDIDLVYKRSTNHGRTWTAVKVLDNPGEGWGASNPTPVTDRDTGKVWIIYNRWEPTHGTANSEPGTDNNQTWARHSSDNGRTWSSAVDLTRVARDYDNWGANFVGPGGAIQAADGRLLIPSAHRPDSYYVTISIGGFEGLTSLMRAYAIYSDDHGATWKRGALVKAQTNENQLVELADGAIMMDARQGAGDHRWLILSKDGGETWTNPVPGQTVTRIAASIERFTLKSAGDDRNRILWTGPKGPGRKQLVIRTSYDEGQTFRDEKIIYGGLAAYSDITILKDKTVGVIWERGVSEGYQFVTFTRLDQSFLEGGSN